MVLNLVIALVLEQFRLKDNVKLGIQRKEVLKAAQQVHVSLSGEAHSMSRGAES